MNIAFVEGQIVRKCTALNTDKNAVKLKNEN